MEFLVRFEVAIPPELSAADLEAMMSEERKRGESLWASGQLVRLWRVPGTRASVGLYDFPDATALHAQFSTMPLFPHMRVHSVEPLAVHPAEAERRAGAAGDGAAGDKAAGDPVAAPA